MKTDALIQQDGMDELKWEPALNATEIGVAVHNGVVTLSGYVNSYAKKFAAERAAWRVKGVKAVAEELEIRLPGDSRVPDEEIADSIVRTLKWNTAIPDERTKVKVTGGWVYLEGEVDWNFQKEAAFNAVRHLKGVTGVTNLIAVKPRVNTVLVKDSIRKALERSADLEAANVRVDTLGSKVILRGTARSWAEKRTIENAAWSAPGVATIDDELIIA